LRRNLKPLAAWVIAGVIAALFVFALVEWEMVGGNSAATPALDHSDNR
jgi:hypothetical protein